MRSVLFPVVLILWIVLIAWLVVRRNREMRSGDYAWLIDCFTRLGELTGQAVWTDRAVARDLLTGNEYDWGQFNFVRLEPAQPAHIFLVSSVSNSAANPVVNPI